MSLYVLDTDVVSLYRLGHAVVCRRVDGIAPAGLATTVITVEEQLTGWYTSLRRTKKVERLAEIYDMLAESVRFFSRIEIISFAVSAIAIYQNLKSQRLNLGSMDLRIAAIALDHDACLVTRNLRDFQRIPGLQVEDWTV